MGAMVLPDRLKPVSYTNAKMKVIDIQVPKDQNSYGYL